jgi:hypothetical protein
MLNYAQLESSRRYAVFGTFSVLTHLENLFVSNLGTIYENSACGAYTYALGSKNINKKRQ